MESFKPQHFPEKQKAPISMEDLKAMSDEAEILFNQSINHLDKNSKSQDSAVIEPDHDKKIIDGYKTAKGLLKEIRSDRLRIKNIADDLARENPELEAEIQRNAKNGTRVVDAYSPKLVELIKAKLGEQVREGYQSARHLESLLRSSKITIEQTVDELVNKDPSLELLIQRNATSWGRTVDAYSPELVELIKAKLGEQVREGYKTAGQLQETLNAGSFRIKSIVDQLIQEDPTLDNYIQQRAKNGPKTVDAYSPELVELIKAKLGEQVREGYKTAGQLQTTLKSSDIIIKSIVVELLKEKPTLVVHVQRGVNVRGFFSDAYSPELVELIKAKLGEQVREGYKTAGQLQTTLKSSDIIIKKTVNQMIQEEPELESEIQRDANINRHKVDFYSPRLINLIKTRLGEREQIKDGYLSSSQLQPVLQSTQGTIEPIIDELIRENPELEAEIQRNAMNGPRVVDAYSPKLVELIKAKLGEQVREGYQSASQLQITLKTSKGAVRSIVNELVQEDPELEAEIQRDANVYGQRSNVYSPKLVGLIKAMLGEQIKDGYQNARQLQSVLKANKDTIGFMANGLILENPELEIEIQKNANSWGRQNDAYSPKLVELIKAKLGEQVREGYQSASQLQPVLRSTLPRINNVIDELIRENPELEAEIQRGAKNRHATADAYSPKLVELIKAKLGEQVREGYQSASQLQEDLKSSQNTIKSIVDELIHENQGLEMQIQRNAKIRSRVVDTYSPELIEIIKSRLAEIAPGRMHADRGLTLQYSLEILLKIINNSNIFVEKAIKIPEGLGSHRPDLIKISENGDRVIIIDIKLQTTTSGISKDIKNYTSYIKENFPKGGNLVFLCLNGPDFPSELSESAENIKIRFYHVLDFLERFIDNNRNKLMLRMMTGNESDMLGEVTELSPEQITKIKEIADQLRILKDIVSRRENSTRNISLEEADKRTAKIRTQMRKLARGNVSIDDILNTNFKEIMDF